MKIGVDIDDVLTESLPEYIRTFTRRFGIEVPLSEATWALFARHPEIPKAEVEAFVAEMDSSRFLARRLLDPEARMGLQELVRQGHTLYIVTGRLTEYREVTHHWLLENRILPLIRGIFYKDGGAVGPYKKAKAAELALDLFLEDELHVATLLADLPVTVLLVDRPWNQGELPPNVLRVRSWTEILAAVAARGR